VSGNDEERLLRVALRVVSDHAGPLQLRAGLNAGRFFVHDAGRPERRVYSFSGDAVNLAARVMARAQPGEVLATDSLLDRVRSNVRAEPLPPFLVKGKTEPVVASHVLGVDRDSDMARDDDAFVGREQELATLVEAAIQSSNGRGQVVDVVAEPGMGKSRLIAEAASRWELATRRVVCESYGDAAPYAPFNHLLRALLQIPEDAGSAAVAEALRGFVTARSPALMPWLPLLAAVLDVTVRATPEVDRLEPRFRRERLEEATVSLLDALVTSPTAIIFEDAHAADDPSRSLVARIAAVVATRQWLLVVTRRPHVDLGLPRDAPWFSEVRLDSLSAEESASLLATATNAPALLPHERRLLMERAGGSPLFLRELLEGYRATGSVEELPDTLEPLLALQVDRLAPADRSLLRAAAVLGVWFDLQTLTDLLGSSVALDSTVWDRLAPFVVDETAGQKRFRHSLVRDAAYEGLSFKRRRVLHGSAAESIAGRSVTPEEHASLLSLHSLHAERFADAWRYARVAGDKASELYANVEAAAYYRRALSAARRLPGVPGAEVGHVWESLGDASERAGEYGEAAHAYATSRKVSRTRTDRARLLRKSGIVHERNARYRAALSCYTRGRTLTREPVDKSEAVELCELTVASSGVRFRQGRHLECLEWAEAAVEQAAQIEYRPGMAHALYLQDIALSSLGRPSNGTAERALAIYEEMRDLIGQGNVLNNMGVEAYFRGRWTDALQLYERSGAAREQAGDIAGAATEQNNIAEILSDQGHAARARELFLVAREAWLAAGYNVGVALATSNLGRLAARCGMYEEAGLLLRDARDRFRSIGAAVHALEAEARLVELLVLEQRTDEAKSDAELLASKVEALGVADALETMTRRLLGIAKAHGGDRAGGLAELDRSVARAADQGEEFELALGLAARVSLQYDSATSGSSRLWRADAARAVDMLESLGVVDVPVTSSDDRWPQHGVAIFRT
jgi:tetratricopeptide (TPR) repeat protein